MADVAVKRLEDFEAIFHGGFYRVRAGLGVVAVSNSNAAVDRTLAAAVEEIERVEPGLITRTEVEFLT